MSETKITVIYDNPVDADAFEQLYNSEQLPQARKIPGYNRIETSRVWPKEDGTPTPAHRMIDLYFSDSDAASKAVASKQAEEFFEAMASLATGGVRVLFSHIELSADTLHDNMIADV